MIKVLVGGLANGLAKPKPFLLFNFLLVIKNHFIYI